MTSPKEHTRRYSIEIKDASGRSVWFAAADWTDEERRIKGSIKLSFGHQHQRRWMLRKPRLTTSWTTVDIANRLTLSDHP